MGNPTGFMDYERKDPGYRPKHERVKDFKAVEYEPTEDYINDQAARCMDCGTPFCHAYGCPVANIIPEFNDLLYRGQWKQALEILLATNNFPEFTGRLCPAVCEAACVEGIHTDPVAIRQIELAIIEKGFEKGMMGLLKPVEHADDNVAVIGAGPSGLAVADTLNRSGFQVTVFDEAEQPGGLLRYGIPDFKMEKRIVERRITLMEQEGVVFEKGVVAGSDISARYLKRHFDAICLACGARKPRDLSVPDRDLSGIHFALDYLIQQNKRVGGEQVRRSDEILARDKSVVVIGGGDTGSDCLGTAIRQGAKNVVQLEILPKPPLERSEKTPWPTWPLVLRETHAHKEGGEIKWGVTAKSFTGEKGAVKKIRCIEVEWQTKEGRSVPIDVAGSDFEIKADLVLLAMGFTGPGNSGLIENFDLRLDERGNVWSDQSNMTSIDGVFVAGDMATGQSLIVRAINSGRQTAMGMIAYLSQKKGAEN